MSSPLVLISRADAVTTLTLNRPDRRNALGVELLEELCSALTLAEADPTQRVLVLRGAGPVFCAGLDLTEAADPARAETSAALIARVLHLVSSSHLVTLAIVHGAAVAGGAGLMSACDFVVAAEGTKIGYPEVRRGLVAGLVMTFLRRQLRERDVREILLTGALFSADRAHAIGLVNRVVPATALSIEADTIIAAALAGGPEALARTKALLAELWPHTVDEDLDRALSFHLTARNSAEAREGVAAFREKRAPAWEPKK